MTLEHRLDKLEQRVIAPEHCGQCAKRRARNAEREAAWHKEAVMEESMECHCKECGASYELTLCSVPMDDRLIEIGM
jgi:hypothetical protein